MDLELLKKFYYVAEEGSVTRAAKRIYLTQSALSKAISYFEYRLKTDLFVRTRRGMELTPQGERLYAFAKKLVHEADSFEKAFHEKDDEIEGDLRIVTTPYLGTEWLMFKIKNFLTDYPKLKIKLIVREDKDVEIEEGDVAISSPRQHQPHLIQKRLFISYMRLVASQSYLEKNGVPKKPGDLDFHQLITYGGTTYNPYGSTNWVLNMGKNDNAASRGSYMEVNSLQGLINATLAGYGIAEVPDFPGVLRSGLVEIVLNNHPPKLAFDIHYIYHEKRKHSKKINLLFKYLAREEKNKILIFKS